MKRQTWSGDWPLPNLIRLPGARVKVKVVPPDDTKLLNGCDGATIYSHEKQACVIFIDGSLPIEIQRYTLIHELDHVLNELRDVMLEHYPAFVHPRSMHPQPTRPVDVQSHPENGSDQQF